MIDDKYKNQGSLESFKPVAKNRHSQSIFHQSQNLTENLGSLFKKSDTERTRLASHISAQLELSPKNQELSRQLTEQSTQKKKVNTVFDFLVLPSFEQTIERKKSMVGKFLKSQSIKNNDTEIARKDASSIVSD